MRSRSWARWATCALAIMIAVPVATADRGSKRSLADCALFDQVDKSEDVHTLEFDRYAITVDERDKKAQSLIIKDKISGDSIEFDGVAPGIVIKATAALIIDVDGLVSIDASSIVLNGRKISDGSSNI